MRVFPCVVAGLLVFAIAAGAAADHHESDLLKELEALGDSLTEAMLANDVETMLGVYAEDAISLPNYGPRMQGIEAFRQHHEQMTGAGMKILSFESAPTEAWEAGDHVIEIGTFEIELTVPGMPDPVEDRGKYMTVYVRDADGKLKIKAETWNTDVNPMQMMGQHGHAEAPAAEPAEEPQS